MQAAPISTVSTSALPLRVNFAWMLIGNIIQAGAQWGVVVVLARLGSPEDVGGYALALAIVSPVFLFSNMHLRAILATDVALETRAGTYFSLRLASSSLAALALLVAAVFRGPQQGLVLAGLTAAKAFEAISEVLYGEMQRTEQMDRIGKSMAARWGGALLVTAAAMNWSRSLLASLISIGLVSAAVAFWDLRTVRASRWRSSFGEMKQLAVSAAPLGLLMLMVSLNASIPRYYLAGLSSQSAVGVFAALSYVSIALNTLVIASGQAGGTSMARSFWARDGFAFAGQAARLLALALALGIAGVGASLWKGPELLELLYGPFFSRESEPLNWLMIAGALSYVASAMGYMLASARCFHMQLPTLILTSLTTALCCHLLVPQGGVAGAAKAQFAGYAVQTALSALLLIYSCARRFQ
ncbi:MAG: oligosaccharide flippase family protein [Acidobacteria bacterium]|nr:oligosaccharide flippase family protein [Acidobacteriota bacterium]